MSNLSIKLTIDRFEGGQAVLITDDKQAINWPKDKLPAEVRAGSVLYFSISPDPKSTQDNKNLAKDILNEILS